MAKVFVPSFILKVFLVGDEVAVVVMNWVKEIPFYKQRPTVLPKQSFALLSLLK